MGTLTLPVKLTDAEMRDRAQNLGNRINELALVEEKKKDAAAGFKAQVDELEKQIRDLGRVVRTGSEDRDVEVKESFDFLAKLSRTIRIDTGDVVRSRAATVDEIREHEQPFLPFGAVKPAAEVAMPDDGAGPPPADEVAHAVSHESAEVAGATVTPMPTGEKPDEPKKGRKAKASASA